MGQVNSEGNERNDLETPFRLESNPRPIGLRRTTPSEGEGIQQVKYTGLFVCRVVFLNNYGVYYLEIVSKIMGLIIFNMY